MPTTWRDQMKTYKDRWIVGLAIGLSLLFHIALIAAVWSGAIGFSNQPGQEAIVFDLADMPDPSMLQQQQKPDRLSFQDRQANGQRPPRADAYGYQNHDAGAPSHRDDQPINEIDQRQGPRGPGRGAAGTQGGGRPQLPPIPQVGEGVGEPSEQGAPVDESARGPRQPRSVDQMIGRAGMKAPGGGDGAINPYNPNVGDGGKSVSISTEELKYMGYFAHMREKIYLAWVYPQEAQRAGAQGVTFLRFTVMKSGEVSEATVLQTSGYPILDRYAVKAVREAHFNPMPANWPEDHLTVSARFHYQLVGARVIQ